VVLAQVQLHSIFFHEGYAIHGTIYVSRLGRRASHGCVRLHPKNAAALFDLVRSRGMRSTTIVVSNTDYVAKPELNLRSSLPPNDAAASPVDIPPPDVLPDSTGTVLPTPDIPPASAAASDGKG
jgi:hypothetical protein